MIAAIALFLSLTWPDFFKEISTRPAGEIYAAVDSIIALEPDSTRADLAGAAYDWFSNSPLMGNDAVAVYVADNYFLNRKLKWPDESSLAMLKVYADYNRQTLIGCDAPELRMENRFGRIESLRRDGGHYKLVYFYDAQCSTCRRYTRALADMARSYSGGRLSFFAIYTGQDRLAWMRYIKENFYDITTWKVDMHHLWDPDDTNGYHLKYGVLTAPTLLLLDSQNKVIGRSLDPDAAGELLGVSNKGARAYSRLFNALFSALQPVDTAATSQLAATLAAKAAGDSSFYRETFYELFNYLRDNPSYQYKASAALVAERYIVGQPAYWSGEYLSKVSLALEKFNSNPIGGKAPDLELLDRSGRSRKMLAGRPKYTLLMFHIAKCPDCAREFKVMERDAELYRRKGVKVICIYAGKSDSLWREFIPRHDSGWTFLADASRIGIPGGIDSRMGEIYDIDFVPKMYLLDRRKRIIAKDFDAVTLKALLEER